MSTYLRYDKLALGKFQATGDVKLQAQFLDERGNAYHWVPRWKDVIDLLEKASNVEGFNKPQSTWLADFAGAVKHVLANAHKLALSASKIYGHIDSISDGSIVILPIHFDGDEWCHYTHVDRRDEVSIPAAFAIDPDWCFEHLGRAADILIVNGYAVRVKLRAPETPA